MKIKIKVVYSTKELVKEINEEEFDVIIYECKIKNVKTSEPNGKKKCFVVLVSKKIKKIFNKNQLEKFSNWEISHGIGEAENCHIIPSDSERVIEDLKQVFKIKNIERNKAHQYCS